MEAKKNAKYDLHRQSGKFFLIGLIISSVLAIMAFEWTSPRVIPPIRPEEKDETFPILDKISVTGITPKSKEVHKLPKPVFNPDLTKIKAVDDNEATDSLVLTTEPINSNSFIAPEPIDSASEIFIAVEKQPYPVGGLDEFYKIIKRELKYPRQARQMGREGKAIVQFVVGKAGELTDFVVLQPVGAGCDEEAIRVLSKTQWEPGRQRGKPVKVRMAMAIKFELSR